MPKKVATAILILILILVLVNITRQIYTALQAGKRLDQSAGELSALQNENQRLKQQLMQAGSYDSVEKIARDSLNLAKSNETVVIIPRSEIDKILASEKKSDTIVLPNWQGWLKLVLH